jgi:hypothetical protein
MLEDRRTSRPERMDLDRQERIAAPARRLRRRAARVRHVQASALVAALLLGPAVAAAHQPGLSSSEIAVVGEHLVSVRLRLAVAEVASSLALDRDGDAAVTGADLMLTGPDLFAPLRALAVSADGAPCRLAPENARLEPPDGLVLSGRWTCPGSVHRLEVRVGFLGALPPGHTHLARVEVGGRSHERVVRAAADSFAVEREPTGSEVAARFLALGVEHIFTGYDHVAFLVGLLLLGGTLRSLVKVVSSFTVAHSVTLALAVLGLVTPPARLVEPLIALSIVFVAAENLWALRRNTSPERRRRATERRWRVTAAFGLVHGFGFASVLRELHLPRSALAASLVSFNLGVELGQVAIVLVTFPVLVLLRRSPRFSMDGVRVASAALGAFGLLLLAQRAVAGG